MADATVLTPEAFNERFTIYLNTEGKPVQRTLREMTPAEVAAAIDWNFTEADRLDRESAPFAEIAKQVEAGNIPSDVTPNALTEAIEAMHRAATANIKAVRLVELVRAHLAPQWNRHPGMKLSQAVRRFWPSGRAA